MATTISTQDIVDAKRDIEDIGEAVNEVKIVSPRYGEDFKSLPMIAAEAQDTIGEWRDAINTIADEDGVPALAVSTASGENQQNINDYNGAKWRDKAGGYDLNARVMLDNGDIVRSTVAGNTVDPNVDMTGWHSQLDYQNSINNQRPTALQLESIGSDGILNASTGLQALATAVDLGLKPYIFLPFYNNNYKLDSTVVIQEPMMLWGDAVPTYNRGDGKKGKILLNTEIGFNLGNGRTSGAVLDIDNKLSKNPADQWAVKNIAFFPLDRATQQYTQTAIMHDSKTNGPDRGFLMREVSASRVKHAIHVKDNDVQTHLSNLEVTNCCLSNSELPILADGNVWCGRIVNNQIEQNHGGAIHGVFHAGLTIHDNMLEGNRNTIYIKDHPKDRDGCYLSLERNYFEGSYGDYLVKIESFQSNSIASKGNYVSGFLSSDGITPNTNNNLPKDHFLLTNLYSSIFIYDKLSVTFFNTATCDEDNNLKRFLVYAKPSNYIKLLTKLDDAKLMASNSAVMFNLNNKVATEEGELYFIKNSSQYTDVPITVAANDVVQLVFSYYSEDADLAPTSITIVEAISSKILVNAAGFGVSKSNGRIKTVNFVFTVPANASGTYPIRFMLGTSNSAKTFSILGASAKKLGVYNASTSNPLDNRFIVEKSKPVLRRVVDGLKYSDILAESTIANGATLTKTYTVSGATSSNRVEALLHSYDGNLSVSARVSAANTIQVSIKNNGTTPITIPNTTELAYTIY